MRLLPADPTDVSKFGRAVDVHGDTAAVSARGTFSRGEVYIFERDVNGPTPWVEQTIRSGPAIFIEDYGSAIALHGDLLAVGAPGHRVGSTTPGAVFLYERNAGGPNAWGEVAKLLPPPVGEDEPRFGSSVAIEQDRIVVGAELETTSIGTGAVYLFERDPGDPSSWNQIERLQPVDIGVGFRFGRSVALSGDTVLVGRATPGTFYIFDRDQGGPGAWGQVTHFDGTGNSFAKSLELCGDTALVGAPGNTPSGSALVYQREEGTNAWIEVAELKDPGTSSNDEGYGSVVALHEDLALVARPGSTTGSAIRPGRVFVHGRNQGGPGAWGLLGNLTPATFSVAGLFGGSLAIDETTVLAGSSCEFVPPGQTGAGEMFEILGTPAPASTSPRNAGTNPDSLTAGTAVLGGTLELTCDTASTGHIFAWVFAFDTPGAIALAGGQTLLSFDGGGMGELLTGSGMGPVLGPTASFSIAIPNQSELCGMVLHCQALHALGIVPFALSNAQDATLGL